METIERKPIDRAADDVDGFQIEIDSGSQKSDWVRQYLDWYRVDEAHPHHDDVWPRMARI
jgi:hypothetical protein